MSFEKPNVILISVDALKPEFVFEQERLGMSLPNLTRYFAQGGTFARGGVQSVFPTFTYPCHQSIITGTNPATHGVFNNGIFDPTNRHNGAWHWFASDKTDTLWELAKQNGYLSASVAFPTSVGARGDYIIPEFWWDGSALDSRFIDAVSTPQGIVREMEQEIGQCPNGLDLSDESDHQRYRAAMWVLQNKLLPRVVERPFFLSAYFASFDESAHVNGVYSPEAAQSLQKIDTMLGELIDYVMDKTRGTTIVCVVSDHGTLDNRFNISPNVLLKQAGLITTDEQGRVLDWRAWSQRAGGVSEIRLRSADDTEAADALRKVMTALQADPASGILEVLDRQQATRRGGFPLADWVLVADKGYEIRDDVTGDYCRTALSQKAQHGYSEAFPEMHASFMLTGKGIDAGRDIGEMNLIDIAPTLAELMGFSMPRAEGVSRI